MDDLCAGIFEHFIQLVHQEPPETILAEFRALFIDGVGARGTTALGVIYQLAFRDREDLYHLALRRCCYIAINNWMAARREEPVRQLVTLLAAPHHHGSAHSASPSLQRIHSWLQNFVASEDYENLRLFVARHDIELLPPPSEGSEATATATSTALGQSWTRRFAGHLLLERAEDPDLSEEERHALRERAQQLRDRFRFDLAMFAVRSQSPRSDRAAVTNPTGLGDGALRVVKLLVQSMRRHGYASAANLFLTQTRGLTYEGYKRSLKKYLTFAVPDLGDKPHHRLCEAIDGLYGDRDEEPLTDALHLQTCQRVIALLTTENYREPSRLFVLLLSGGHGLTLVLLLLKVAILCPSARSHLDLCVAKLLRHYEALDEAECRWVVHFFEMFNVAFAIHSNTIRFDLVSVEDPKHPRDRAAGDGARETKGEAIVAQEPNRSKRKGRHRPADLKGDAKGTDLDRYRVFSQISSSVVNPFPPDPSF
ncbi:MAG: hypothetical protein MH825_01000 [Cyanobacteria bacterium]|nr:hypothetical protein [Cyanobacteriota bacterium]